MQKLDGKEVAQHIKDQLAEKIKEFQKSQGRAPGLSVILVGEDPASHVYVKNKIKSCEQVGIISSEYKMSDKTTEEQLKSKIEELNNDNQVDGILVQLPLPKHLNEDKILSFINPKKDPDALTQANLGAMLSGKAKIYSCTPSGVIEILKYYDIPIEGKQAVVVGRSNIVGKPMALLLQKENATVTVCHSRTFNTQEHTKQADIVVAAAGKMGLLGKEDFKKGSVIIDVGIHRTEVDGKTKLKGDVRYEELEGWAQAATPVPGGVGPMTIAMLLSNTLILAIERSS